MPPSNMNKNIPGVKFGKALWNLLPSSGKKLIYSNPRGVDLALEYITGSGKPMNIDLTLDQVDLINNVISKSKESNWVPSTNINKGRTYDKGYSHQTIRDISDDMYDLLGKETTLSRMINPATKDTTYNIIEDWDLKQGEDGRLFTNSRQFDLRSIPKPLMSLLSLYQKLGYIQVGREEYQSRGEPWKTDIGVTDKFVNAGKPVPMNFPSIYRPFNQGGK